MKTCSECKDNKPLTEFSKNRIYYDGLQRQCKKCRSIRRKADYQKNKTWELHRKKLWDQDNKDKRAEYAKSWRKNNMGKVNAQNSKRRASKLKATPSWADQDQIKRIYVACAKISEQTGTKHHVDHIIPLQGENVCGLHVENNLAIIPAKMNLQKSNKFRQKNNG